MIIGRRAEVRAAESSATSRRAAVPPRAEQHRRRRRLPGSGGGAGSGYDNADDRRRRRARCLLDVARFGAVLLVLVWVGAASLLLVSGDAGDADGAGQSAAASSGRGGATTPPLPPPLRGRGGTRASGGGSVVVVAAATTALGPPRLLTDPASPDLRVDVSASVRGNLAPPSVMLNSGTDWIKDRWQAASDMGGTAIRGRHWVMLDFIAPDGNEGNGGGGGGSGFAGVIPSRVVLDWEAAYCDDYSVEGRSIAEGGEEAPWSVLYDTSDADAGRRREVTTSGQSPGVKTRTPLHVVHDIDLLPGGGGNPVRSLRVTMRRPAVGWGVSLWRVEVYGWVSKAAAAAADPASSSS